MPEKADDVMIMKLVQEIHKAQSVSSYKSSQLAFMTKMCNAMADELASIHKTSQKDIIEKYAIRAYDEVKP